MDTIIQRDVSWRWRNADRSTRRRVGRTYEFIKAHRDVYDITPAIFVERRQLDLALGMLVCWR